MNIQSTIFSRAKMKTFKKQSLFCTILGIIVIFLAFSILGTSIKGINKSKDILAGLLIFGGLVVTAFGIKGFVIAPKIEAYLELTGRASCTGREYEEWAATHAPIKKPNTANFRQNAKAAPSRNSTAGNASSSQPKVRIVNCPNCGAQLRLPDNGKKLKVTCPRCTNKFIV